MGDASSRYGEEPGIRPRLAKKELKKETRFTKKIKRGGGEKHEEGKINAKKGACGGEKMPGKEKSGKGGGGNRLKRTIRGDGH